MSSSTGDGLSVPSRVAAEAPAAAAAVVPFTCLLKKELLDHIHGRRVWIGSIIFVTVCALAALIRIADYREANASRAAFLERWRPSVQEQLERDETIQVDNTRAVSPLMVLSVGLEPITPFRFTSTKEGLRFGELALPGRRPTRCSAISTSPLSYRRYCLSLPSC